MPVSSAHIPLCRYRLCDFILESEWTLPELVAAPPARRADVVVRRGATPRELLQSRQHGVCFAAQPGVLLCWLDGVARFHVGNGCEIVVEASPEVAEETVRSLLFSSPLAGLLLQRGLVPLHASAVATSRGALVFPGAAGAGKSTLAAEFRRRGFGVLADDIAALRLPDQGAAGVLPVSGCLRLWPAATPMAQWGEGETLVRPGLDKRLLVNSDGVPPGEGVPLVGIVCLDRGEGVRGRAPRRLGGREALAALLDAVYRPAFARGLGLDGVIFRQLSAVATTVPVFQFAVADRMSPHEMAEIVLEEFTR